VIAAPVQPMHHFVTGMAGFAGFLIFFAPRERHDAIRRTLHPLRNAPFDFAPRGSKIIFVN
jgi:galactokinase/mevalonate kinase-like predicted kinase